MTKIRAPKTVGQATALLERHAELEGHLAGIEARRTRMLARANAAADRKAAQLVEELAKLAALLEPWWKAEGAAIAPKGQKSLQLGGCMIGSRAGKPKLFHLFDSDDDAVELIKATRLKNHALRVKYSLDRTTTLKLLQLEGKAAEQLVELGFGIDQDEIFFVSRVAQDCTIG